MEWLEISIEARKGTEALSDLLEGMGVSGLVIEDGNDFEKFMDENRQYWDYVDEDLSRNMHGKSIVKGDRHDSLHGTLIEKFADFNVGDLHGRSPSFSS